MKIGRGLKALLARLGYLLSCYKFMAFRADLFLLLLLAVGAIVFGWRGWREGFRPGLIMGLAACLLGFASLWWLRWREYTVFVPAETEPAWDQPLEIEQKLSLRGSGYFGVNGVERRLMDIPALFWITELGEYIVMGRLQLRNIPLLDAIPEEQGMWYIFFRPADIRSIQAGDLHCGWRARRAVRITYRDEQGTERQLYLACETSDCQRQLLAELKQRPS